jgi:protease IV
MFAPTHRFSDEEWEKVNAWLDRIYADFTGKVAAGRRLTEAQVEEVARGRVWTGADALTRGLVDELGGLETAVSHARSRAGLSASAPLRLYPRASPLDRIRPPGSSDYLTAWSARSLPAAGTGLTGLAGTGLAGTGLAGALLAEAWGPVAAIAARVGLPPSGPLIMPGTWTIQ